MDWLKEILGEGYTDEIDKKLSGEIGKRFIARDDFNTVNEAKKQLEKTVAERDKQLETLKTAGTDTETLKQTIATLQAENKTKADEYAAELAKIKTDNVVEKALMASGAKNSVAAKALLAGFLDKAELDADGSVKGLEAEIAKLAANADTGFLFEAKPQKPPIAGATPAGSGDSLPDPKISGYVSRLAEARKNNNTLAAIQIKQEAAAEGITLF